MAIKGKTAAAAIVFCLAVFLTIGLSPSALAIGDDLMGGIKLTDPELDEIRGGYGGFYLGVYWSLFIDTLGEQASQLATTGPIAIGDSGMIAQVEGNGLTITAGVGSFNGSSGIYNIVQATGNNLTIISNLSIHIALVTVNNQSAIPNKLSGFTPW